MNNKLSLAAKISIIVLSIIILAAIVTIAVLLVNSKKDTLPNNEEVVEVTKEDERGDDLLTPNEMSEVSSIELWERLNGYWTSEGSLFVEFIIDGDDLRLEYGLLQSGYMIGGVLTSVEAEGPNQYVLTIYVPASPATALNDAIEERTESVFLNISALDSVGTIDIKLENNGNGDWHTYEYIEDPQALVSYTTDHLFAVLYGYWYTVTDDSNPFIGFFGSTDDYSVEYGVAQTWFGFKGKLIDCQPTGDKVMALTVYFPPVTNDENQVVITERTETVIIDMNMYEIHGSVMVKIIGASAGDFKEYFYAGQTTEEAYANWPLAT